MHRLRLTLRGEHTQLVSPWSCMLTFHSSFCIVGSQLEGLMMVMVSMDRLLAVRWFAYYRTLTNRWFTNS